MTSSDRVQQVISRAVIVHRLEAITREMGAAMLRSARSPVFAENRDFVTAVFDGRLRMVAQTAYIPVLLGSTPFALEAIAARFEGDIDPGDVFLVNDPYSGNNHLPDLTVVRPVFVDQELLFWALARGHHADVGGLSVGGYNPAARTVWEEGIRIPPVKLYRGGVRNDGVWDLFLANVRLPELVAGDLQCQVGATAIGARAIEATLAAYGRPIVADAVQHHLASSEADMRAQIRSIPDGDYSAERRLDNTEPGADDDRTIRLRVSVRGEEIVFDFEGTSPQIASYHNSTYANTVASCLIALFSVVDPDISMNWGSMQAIRVEAPEGSLASAARDAATSMCTTVTCSVIVEAAWLALAQAIPDRAQALWSRRGIAGVSSGINPRTKRPFAVIHNLSKGGSGATLGFDGWDQLSPVSSTGGRAPDPEIFELSSPHRILGCELRPDSAGAGRWRGGHGGAYRVQFLSATTGVILEPSGVSLDTAPQGVQGGGHGLPAYAEIADVDGSVRRVDQSTIYRPGPGDVLTVELSGGGGYGEAAERPVADVLADVLDDVLSIAKARDVYRVAIDPETFEVDKTETARLRTRRQ